MKKLLLFVLLTLGASNVWADYDRFTVTGHIKCRQLPGGCSSSFKTNANRICKKLKCTNADKVRSVKTCYTNRYRNNNVLNYNIVCDSCDNSKSVTQKVANYISNGYNVKSKCVNSSSERLPVIKNDPPTPSYKTYTNYFSRIDIDSISLRNDAKHYESILKDVMYTKWCPNEAQYKRGIKSISFSYSNSHFAYYDVSCRDGKKYLGSNRKKYPSLTIAQKRRGNKCLQSGGNLKCPK